MNKVKAAWFVVLVGVLSLLFPTANAQGPQLPPQKRQATPRKVVEEHFAAIDHCDWAKNMALYADDAELFLPGGSTVKGRKAVGDLFVNFLKPRSQGGFCGMKTIPEQIVVIGNTVNVAWRIEAPFLTEPYRGSEAYETRDGLMVAQVSTFDANAMKFKP